MRFKEKLGFQKRQVAVIGDSHANFLFGAYPDFDIFWVGPVTMHRVGRDGLSSLMLPRWGFPRFDPSPLKHYRFVFLSFGEIDCRAHISRIASSTCKTIEFVITELIEEYLLEIRRVFPDASVPRVMCVPPAPNLYDSDTEIEIRLKMNQGLRAACEKYSYQFVDYWPALKITDGRLPQGLDDGSVHFHAKKTAFLKETISQSAGINFTFQPDLILKSPETKETGSCGAV